MSHTPGPWKSGYGRGVTGPRCAPSAYWDGYPHIVAWPVRAGQDVVAWVIVSGDPNSTPTETLESLLPDAQLIAAAPELLNELTIAARGLRALVDLEATAINYRHTVLAYAERFEAVIDKATRSPQSANGADGATSGRSS